MRVSIQICFGHHPAITVIGHNNVSEQQKRADEKITTSNLRRLEMSFIRLLSDSAPSTEYLKS